MRGWVMLAVTLGATAASAATTPAGLWQTVDDETGKPAGVVRIVESGGVFTGNVEKILVPEDQGKNCVKCADDDDRKDKPVQGMQIIRGIRADGDTYDGGTILDPKKGKVYKCKMTLADEGKHLVVRGFIGISLLGRSQTWTRLE